VKSRSQQNRSLETGSDSGRICRRHRIPTPEARRSNPTLGALGVVAGWLSQLTAMVTYRLEREYVEARKENQECMVRMIDEVRKSLRMPGDTHINPRMG
jgi:hypothetical protein